MNAVCERCGVGHRPPSGLCDWCTAPTRSRFPLAVAGRLWLRRSRVTARLRRRGAVATGVTAGIIVHLIAAAVGVAAGLPSLWQTGFLWSEQWWWALAPEASQPWLFAATRGAAYGALAGFLAAMLAASADRPLSPSTPRSITPSPAGVVALAAFIVSGWDPTVGTQQCLVAAALGAVVGRVTTLVTRAR